MGLLVAIAVALCLMMMTWCSGLCVLVWVLIGFGRFKWLVVFCGFGALTVVWF